MPPPRRPWQQQLDSAYQRADRASRGQLGVIRQALKSFSDVHAAQAAASLAYYGLFSLFPLIVLLMSALGLFVNPVKAYQLIQTALGQVLPDAQGLEEWVLNTVRGVFEARGEATLISGLALLWAASGMFANLTSNINLAWPNRGRSNPLKARLAGIVMVALVYAGLVGGLLASTGLGVLTLLPERLLSALGVNQSLAHGSAVRLGVFVVSVGIFFGLYRWAPRTNAPVRAALTAALVAALGFQGLSMGFNWYMNSGFANYERLYGPLTTIMVLMFWFYLNVVVILFGAHLSAAIALRRSPSPSVTPPPQPNP